jgi:hypothetical protein
MVLLRKVFGGINKFFRTSKPLKHKHRISLFTLRKWYQGHDPRPNAYEEWKEIQRLDDESSSITRDDNESSSWELNQSDDSSLSTTLTTDSLPDADNDICEIPNQNDTVIDPVMTQDHEEIDSLSNCSSDEIVDDEFLSFQENANTAKTDDLHSRVKLCHYDVDNNVFGLLEELGYVKYLCGDLGGKKTDVNAKTISKRVAMYVAWVAGTYDIHIEKKSVVKNMSRIFERSPFMVNSFINVLVNQGASPATILNFINALTSAVDWLLIFPVKRSYYYLHFKQIIVKLRKRFAKADKLRQRMKNNPNTLIKKKRWPQKGLEQLQRYVIKGLPWTHEYVS